MKLVKKIIALDFHKVDFCPFTQHDEFYSCQLYMLC
jgi:hypothetical protein